MTHPNLISTILLMIYFDIEYLKHIISKNDVNDDSKMRKINI